MNRIAKVTTVVCGLLIYATAVSAAERNSGNKTDDSKPVVKASVVAPVQAAPKVETAQRPTVAPVTTTPIERAPVVPLAQSRTGESIKWQVISGGGGRGTSTNYILSSTVGQTAVGPGTSTNYKVNHGFWQNFGPAGCCVANTGNADCSPDDLVDISDLTILIDHLFINNNPLCCEGEGNTDGMSGVDISDLTVMIDHLFINNNPLAPCS